MTTVSQRGSTAGASYACRASLTPSKEANSAECAGKTSGFVSGRAKRKRNPRSSRGGSRPADPEPQPDAQEGSRQTARSARRIRHTNPRVMGSRGERSNRNDVSVPVAAVRARQADPNPGNRNKQRLPQHLTEHPPGRGAERQANPDFTRSTCDAVRHHPIQPDRGQQHRKTSKPTGQSSEHALAGKRRVDLLIDRPHVADDDVAADFAD